MGNKATNELKLVVSSKDNLLEPVANFDVSISTTSDEPAMDVYKMSILTLDLFKRALMFVAPEERRAIIHDYMEKLRVDLLTLSDDRIQAESYVPKFLTTPDGKVLSFDAPSSLEARESITHD